jgi:hypothetical protein
LENKITGRESQAACRQEELICRRKVNPTVILTDYETVLRRQLACEDVSPGAEERPLLEDVTKQRD